MCPLKKVSLQKNLKQPCQQTSYPLMKTNHSLPTGVKAQLYDKRGCPDFKTLCKRRKTRDTDNSSEEEDDTVSLQNSNDSETFSAFENELKLSIPHIQPSNFHQHLKVGDFVLVTYECELYPGQIVQFEDDGEVVI